MIAVRILQQAEVCAAEAIKHRRLDAFHLGQQLRGEDGLIAVCRFKDEDELAEALAARIFGGRICYVGGEAAAV